jgi:sulfate transport system substrate-binding protein
VGGKGDVLLAYENEAITAQQKGEEVDYVIPEEGTILIQNPIAVVSGASGTAQEFVDFTRGAEAQKIFGEKGYRSVREDLVDKSTYPDPTNLFTIDDLGGWPQVNKVFFDPEDSVMASINKDQGFPTEK